MSGEEEQGGLPLAPPEASIQVVEVFPVGHRSRRQLAEMGAAELRAKYTRLCTIEPAALLSEEQCKLESGTVIADEALPRVASPAEPVHTVAILPQADHMVVSRAQFAKQFREKVTAEVDKRAAQTFEEERQKAGEFIRGTVGVEQAKIHGEVAGLVRRLVGIAAGKADEKDDPVALQGQIDAALARERALFEAAFGERLEKASDERGEVDGEAEG